MLVGFDGSKMADDVIKLAHEHAKVFKADVYIVTSLEQGPDLNKEDIDKAESKLEKIATSLRADDITCDTRVFVSLLSPGEDLVRFAKDNDIYEIIIGVKRRSKVGKLVFGSTAQYIILNASCPVVSVNPGVNKKINPIHMKERSV